jgi:hypothetical protein
MGLLGDEAQWKLGSVRLEMGLVLMHDWCTVCTECTIGSQIVFDAPDGLISDMGRVDSCFSPFGDSVSISA